MFSLIITIISIALVVALVAATMYYGGSALSQGSDAADAAGLISGAQQIVAAVNLHNQLQGSEPANVAALVTAKFLSQVPVTAAGSTWTLDTGARTVSISGAEAVFSDALCARINADVGAVYSCTAGADAAPNTFTLSY